MTGLTVTTFPKITDTTPTRRAVSCDDLRDLLTIHDTRPGKDGLLYSFAAWEPGCTRGNKGIIELTSAVFDFDAGTVHPDHLRGKLIGRCAYWHSTHSNTAECPKWRFVLPLSRPVTPAEFPRVHRGVRNFLDLAPGMYDPSCSEPARAYYAPSCPPEQAAAAFSGYTGGELWDVDMLLELAGEEDPDPRQFTAEAATDGDRPGDDFNRRATWGEVLTGWTPVYSRNGDTYWRRPGKTWGISACTYGDSGLLQVFSTSTPFDTGKGYSKFRAFAIIHHGGDFAAASKALRLAGYGGDSSTSAGNAPGAAQDGPNEWGDPVPLPERLPPVKALPLDLIPGPLRPWLADIADRMQAPPDFSTAAAIVALGSIIGRGCGIRPKRRDDWLVIPNIWGAVIGRPSLMKTPAVSEAHRHLSRLEAEAREAYQNAVKAFEFQEQVNKASREAVTGEIKKAVKKGDADLDRFRAQLAQLITEEPTRRRFMTQDGTTEKIGELLLENPRGLVVNRDELAGWLHGLDRQGREQDRAFYLEAWNGTGSFTYDRIARGTLDIPALCLSVFGCITPGGLADYVAATVRGGRGDDGLPQRFQILVWPDSPGEWRNVDRWPDTTAKQRAWTIFQRLADDIPGADTVEGEAVPFLRFSPDGQAVFDEWRGELEARIRGDLPPALESHLAKYRKLMPSLALIFHLVDVADGATPGPVSEDAALMAATWCEYLESHAVRVYGGSFTPDMEAAKEIIKHIRRGEITDGATIREVWRHQWSRLTSSEEVKAGLAVLDAYGWLIVEKPDTGGRRPEVIRLNPKILTNT